MYIENFFDSKIKIIGFIIAWVIIGLLEGYIKLNKLKEQAKWNGEKISKKSQFKIFIKPAVVLFLINIFWVIISALIIKK